MRARPSVWRAVVAAGLCGMLGACSAGRSVLTKDIFTKLIPEQAVAPGSPHVEVATLAALPGNDAGVAAREGRSRADEPYEIAGRVYRPESDPTYDRIGMASWYGSAFHGRRTASGETFDRMALTAAHPTLPLPSYVRVTNLDNDRSIIVRVNDRGPYAHSRLIDVSEQTAELLAFRHDGMTRVRVQYVADAPRQANDGAMLLASYRGPTRRTSAVAFAEDEPPIARGGVVTAMRRLTRASAATDRILMAFDVAAEVED